MLTENEKFVQWLIRQSKYEFIDIVADYYCKGYWDAMIDTLIAFASIPENCL